MIWLRVCLSGMLLLPAAAAAQIAPQKPLPDSKFADARGVRLEYVEYGVPSGPAVVFLQDFHDYFRLEEGPAHRRYLQRFGDTYRVIAPVRRGWGASQDTGWGYDVATQAEDVIGLLDALGIRKAVFVGRVPANQEMIWLAEHHPARVAGLVFFGNPHIFSDLTDPEVRTWAENFWLGACDLAPQQVARTGPRAPWLPHFMGDPSVRIQVPAVRMLHPEFDAPGVSMDLRVLEMVPMIAKQPSCAPGVQEYYQALAGDPGRLKALTAKLAAANRSQTLDDAMVRAFGDHLKTVMLNPAEMPAPDPAAKPGETEIPEPFYVHTRAFLDSLSRESWGGKIF